MGMLDGVRVLDLSRLLPGPACTAWLAGQGASVDRVESPGAGDLTRHIPPFVDGIGVYYAATSRGKRSLALDTRSSRASELIARLLARYDVLVEGFRPGVLEAMGLGPEILRSRHPRLIVARLSGFGQTGPWARRVGHDINYMGLAGALHGMARVDGLVPLPSVQVADLSGAMVAASGIASALYQRERTGQGVVLDVSLTESALWMMGPNLAAVSAEGADPEPGGAGLTGGLPIYGTYRCADGRFLTLGALEPKFQAELRQWVPELDRPAIAAWLATRPRDAWVELLDQACVGPLLSPSEVGEHPHLVARGAVERLGTTSWVRPPLGEIPDGAPPERPGAHTVEILLEGGLSALEVEELVASGTVA